MTPSSQRKATVLVAATAVFALAVAGCTASREAQEPPPDEQFGHRYEDGSPDGRVTVAIQPPDSTQRYFFYPAVYDTVNIRPARPEPSEDTASAEVPVEVLVKGAFPDGCSELHDVHQQRVGHIITVELRMRRPQGAVCASVVRPYRFYMLLDGTYEPGAYTLKLNDRVHTFEIRPPSSE